ncbi:LruC domain-containing protein [Bacteroides cellulosilyticus]|mgnify:FL=1|jgi:LruC domain-containing protein|nr:LruC domain-containing protein [Bacteroides cellulosilyticus]
MTLITCICYYFIFGKLVDIVDFLPIFATDSTFSELQFKIKYMKQRKMKQLVFVSLVSALTLNSCADKDVYQGEQKNKPISPTEVFDFDLMQKVNINVDYGFENDYYIVFELYDQNPLIKVDDLWVKDEVLVPLYSASTNDKGQYSSTIQIPSGITKVWLYTDYLGAVSPVELAILANGEIRFNQTEYIASIRSPKTKAITSGGYQYPDDWMIMEGVNWDEYGYPSNMEMGLSMPPAEILYSIKDVYRKSGNETIRDRHPKWFSNNATSEIKITKVTELSLVFIGSTPNWANTVGYFTYPTGTIPTPETIQKIIAFPNASSFSNPAGVLLCGNEVKLKYWDGEKFEDKFPEGVTVGWCLEGNAFRQGDIIKQNYAGTRYSYSAMNEVDVNGDFVQRVVALRNSDQIVAIGFEDNKDYDYCDATFYLKSSEYNAIDPDLPELPIVEPPKNLTVSYSGTLTFEDQWPSAGDYDMNDVVMEYQSTVYKYAKTDEVYKIIDVFTPVHDGASFTCGFGYELHGVAQSDVSKITISGPEGWEIEEDQSHPTIVLFNNHKAVLGDKYVVTIELKNVAQDNVIPPYNPFIFVKKRDVEVHLVKGAPTSKADIMLFNTKSDISDIANGNCYIMRFDGEVDLMPFGIHIPIHRFKVPKESKKIYETYPDFIEWVTSGGEKNANWYKN